MKNKINRTLLKKLGFEDYREFVIAFGHWAYTTDFTYRSNLYEVSFDRLLAEYIKERLSE